MSEGGGFERRIIHLPGTRLTPGVVLHRTLTKLDRIKAIVVVIQWDDDTFDTDWSQQKTSELLMATTLAQQTAIDVARGVDRGDGPIGPGPGPTQGESA